MESVTFYIISTWVYMYLLKALCKDSNFVSVHGLQNICTPIQKHLYTCIQVKTYLHCHVCVVIAVWGKCTNRIKCGYNWMRICNVYRH